MPKDARISSKYNVHLIDFTPLHQQALEYVNRNQAEKNEPLSTACKPLHQYGFISSGDDVYIIDTEGVGNSVPVTKENPYHLAFYSERKDDENTALTHFSVFPSCEMPLNEEHLHKYATGETQPLHEFIRTFGSRLDANYMNWEHHLDKVAN